MERLTFPEYIRNPSGSRTKIVGETEVARAVYSDKYNKMLLQCAGQINYILWKNSAGDKYVIYVQLPSEKVPKLYYDVVIEFTTLDDAEKRMPHLKQYKVRFFSNDPNFIFTYANAFKRKDLLVKDLLPKISEKALREPPNKTNPTKTVGYVKSLYFVYLFMENKGLFNKLMWLNAGSFDQMKVFFNQYIMHSDRKLLYAQNYQKTLKNKPKTEKITYKESDPEFARTAKYMVNRTKSVKTTQKVTRDMNKRKESNKYVHVIGRKK
jgi:hypothetical protein